MPAISNTIRLRTEQDGLRDQSWKIKRCNDRIREAVMQINPCMTRSFLPIGSLLLVLLSGCAKSHSEDTSAFFGKWKAVRSSGGIAGATTDFTDTRILQLNRDHSFSFTINGVTSGSGEYTVSTLTSGNNTDSVLSLRYIPSNYVSVQQVYFRPHYLTLSDRFMDGFTTFYTQDANPDFH